MMKQKLIITVGRQYGSGGREIGAKLAAKYGIPFYDNELITRAAKESGYCEEMIETHDVTFDTGKYSTLLSS